jgi:hypothetical protein
MTPNGSSASATLRLLVLHDDGEREFAYTTCAGRPT